APATVTVLPQAFTGTWTGACTLFPDSTPGESSAPPPANESARAGVPYRDRMPVAAAAAANTPLLRVCRNVVVFLLEESGAATRSGPPLPHGLLPHQPGSAESVAQVHPVGPRHAAR